MKKALAEFNGPPIKRDLPVASVEELSAALRAELQISSEISITYLDPDFGKHVHLENVADLPERPELRVTAISTEWWEWTVNTSTWKNLGGGSYDSLLVKDGSKTHNQPVLDKFTQIVSKLGFDPKMATKVYAISNKRLFSNFQNYRDSLHGQHQKRADKFKSSDWKKEP